ncbi:MAG TPA: UDP-N-acetylmuramoyl-L-alanine--D-glutamate ligase [Candidatus Bathyarchaeia archaeon]|nr:UDP-N-acetylmuramoyl-L-alanine--D-glutamate ligase [Candidatus Bathyarchaeia archaeon]
MNTHPIIGIWGFGLTGKSILTYYSAKNVRCIIMDKRILSEEEKQVIEQHGAQSMSEEKKEYFFQECDYIFVSQSVYITNYYTTHKNKLIPEIDFFHNHITTPYIAITGSIGKTSVTHLLSQLHARAGIQVLTGGNIGTPLFDLLRVQEEKKYDMAVVEVSNFQLEYAQTCAPDVAVWTNFYPNHLDHHKTEDAYFRAKSAIFAHQKEHQYAIAPLSLASRLQQILPLTQQCIFFSLTPPSLHDRLCFPHQSYCFVDDGWITLQTSHTIRRLVPVALVSSISFLENWLAIAATWYALGHSFSVFEENFSLTLPEHRLEYVGTFRDITFYNDSKSTTPTSTLAAITVLKDAAPVLFLGGLSKGIDRRALMQDLVGKVSIVYCFGQEAQQLASWGTLYGLKTYAYATLDDAFSHCITRVTPGTTILFSPAGSSYDLFTNYHERGTYFKKLVVQFAS